MAKIKHFFRSEKVYEECCDRGITFKDWIYKDVEHFCCSKCGSEVNKNSKYCPNCGEKFTSITEEKITCSCEICGNKFKQMSHENETCCTRCRNLINKKYGTELAKAFYELGKQ